MSPDVNVLQGHTLVIPMMLPVVAKQYLVSIISIAHQLNFANVYLILVTMFVMRIVVVKMQFVLPRIIKQYVNVHLVSREVQSLK